MLVDVHCQFIITYESELSLAVYYHLVTAIVALHTGKGFDAVESCPARFHRVAIPQ